MSPRSRSASVEHPDGHAGGHIRRGGGSPGRSSERCECVVQPARQRKRRRRRLTRSALSAGLRPAGGEDHVVRDGPLPETVADQLGEDAESHPRLLRVQPLQDQQVRRRLHGWGRVT